MTDCNTLIALLQKMAADQLGKYQCYGCGHEYNCANEGCAILRDAVATMEQLYKDVTGSCICCTSAHMDLRDEPCRSCGLGRNADGCWQWRGVQEEERRAK